VIFWDTSAMVRCYAAHEPGHGRAMNLMTSRERNAASVLLIPEVAGAVTRLTGKNRPLAERLLRKVRDDLASFELLPADIAQAELAARFALNSGLKAADALHVAAAFLLARELGRGLRFVTSDVEQAAVARSEKLRVILVN
jgi:predicted nucleic acid-binding protein